MQKSVNGSYLVIVTYGPHHRPVMSNNVYEWEYRISFVLKNKSVHIFSEEYIHVNKEKDICLLIDGDIHCNKLGKSDKYELVLKKYLENKKVGLSSLNGLYSLFLVDQTKNIFLISTDRINSKKVFYANVDGAHIFTDSLLAISKFTNEIDPIGIGSYLVNGTIYNNRTVLKNVRVLSRSSFFSVEGNELVESSYWDFCFTYSLNSPNESELSEQLFSLLQQSVTRRYREEDKINISLSGGYDASSILGILAEEVPPSEIACHSYYLNNLNFKGNDSDVAASQANLYGCNFEATLAMKNDLYVAIYRNAMWGQGIANFSEEIDFWLKFQGESDGIRNIMFFGEEVFGLRKTHQLKDKDLFKIFKIYNIDASSLLTNIVDERYVNEIRNGIEHDLTEIISKIPSYEDSYEKLSYLYFDQRVSQVLMSWRQFFAARVVKPRIPFLDNDILDFVLSLKPKYRYSKNLFIKTIEEKFTRLFEIPRSSTIENSNNWSALLRDNEGELNEILNMKSSLDHIIPIEKVNNIQLESSRIDKFLYKISNYNRKLMKVSPVFFSTRLLSQVNKYDIMKRYLTLKMLMHKLQE